MRTGEGVFLRDVSLDPGFVRADARMVSEIALPLRAHGEFLGVLNVESDAPLDERDLSCVTVVADRVAAALALAR
jgi:putative methionine-R-sulfoxide reductase with GAF domain